MIKRALLSFRKSDKNPSIQMIWRTQKREKRGWENYDNKDNCNYT